MTRKKTINIRDLFVEPNFHELEVSLKTKGVEIMKMKTHQAVATDSKGEPRKLNPAQLESIRQTGQFQVGGRLGLLLISLDWLRFEVWFCWGDVITRAVFSLLWGSLQCVKMAMLAKCACIQCYFEHFLPRNILRHNWNCKNTSNKIIQILHQTTTRTAALDPVWNCTGMKSRLPSICWLEKVSLNLQNWFTNPLKIFLTFRPDTLDADIQGVF